MDRSACEQRLSTYLESFRVLPAADIQRVVGGCSALGTYVWKGQHIARARD